MGDVRRISRFVRNHAWAILPEKLDAICELIDLRVHGVMLSQEEIRARIGAAAPREAERVEAVAVIPLYGVLAQKMNMFTEISGGTSMEQFIAQVRAAVADETVRAIIIDADTPGGTVDGTIEAADALYGLRGTKPIVAVANPLMASAGYWITSQADEVIAAPSGQVGALGVFLVHEDWSAANERIGVTPTYIYAGRYKVEDNPDEPLSDEARQYHQDEVNARYDAFVKAVVRGRNVPPAKVRSDFGEGRTLLAKPALEAGLIDRIGTLDATISRYLGRRVSVSVSRAAAETGAELAEVVPLVEMPEVPAAPKSATAAEPAPEVPEAGPAIEAVVADGGETPIRDEGDEGDDTEALIAALS